MLGVPHTRVPLTPAVTPAPPEAAKQMAFMVWALSAQGNHTKGGKKGLPILLGPNSFPTEAHLLLGAAGRARLLKQAKAFQP